PRMGACAWTSPPRPFGSSSPRPALLTRSRRVAGRGCSSSSSTPCSSSVERRRGSGRRRGFLARGLSQLDELLVADLLAGRTPVPLGDIADQRPHAQAVALAEAGRV